MKLIKFTSLVIIIALLFSHCKQQSILNDNLSEVNTDEEIKVYTDFIDEIYNIYYCHLEMDSPESHFRFDESIDKEEYNKYNLDFEQYIKKFNEMLDTLKITALVRDSLNELVLGSTFYTNLDTSVQKIFNYLDIDTIDLRPAIFHLDSLKSLNISFERIPNKILEERN